MSPELRLHLEPRLPEWRRSGPFFALAAAIHGLVLTIPLHKALSELDIPPPGPIVVKLIEAVQSPQVPPAAPKPLPVASSPPQAAPQQRARPVLAMTPAQQAPTMAAVTPAATMLSETRAAAPPSLPTGPTPVIAARYDAAYLQNPKPNYPALSRRLGEEGKVLLKVRITAEGQPLTVDLEKSSNFERLDEAARQAVTRWRFVPARRGEEAIEASVIVPVVFRLDS